MSKKQIIALCAGIAVVLGVIITFVVLNISNNIGSGSKSGKVTSLGKYWGVEVEALTVEPTEEEIQAEVTAYLESKAYKDAENTVVDDGETVNIDYKGTLDGTEFDGGSAEAYDLKIGSGTFLTGFEEGLVGKSVGETVILDITFPEGYTNSDGNPSDLAGKLTQFEVVINYIYTVPACTDEAVDALEDYATVKELTAYVTSTLKASKQSTSDTRKINSVMLKIINKTKFKDISDDAVDVYYNQEYDYYVSVAENYYGTTLEEFLGYYQIKEDEFKEECKSTAILKVKEDVVLDAIAKKEKITISNKEFDEQVEKWLSEYSTNYNVTKEEIVEAYGGEAACRQSVLRLKVRDEIVDKAVVTAYVDQLTDESSELSDDSAINSDTTVEEEED